MTKPRATLLPFPGTAQAPRGLLAAALRRHRLPDLLIENLLHDAQDWPGYAPQEALACALAKRMRLEAIDFQNTRGILLLGPGGSGKSTVAAKILHTAALAGRKAACAGVTEGLALFRTAAHPGDVLLVMEAEGFNPVNPRAASAFAALGEFHGVDSIGVVSASGDAEDLSEIITSLRFKRLIVTGLDRTLRLGGLAAAVTGGARLAHVTGSPHAEDGLETLEPDVLATRLLA